MSAKSNILTLIWTTWIVLWVLAAVFSAGRARTLRRERSGSRLLIMFLLILGYALLMGSPRVPVSIATPVFSFPLAFSAGVAVTFLGLLFATWARVHLGRFWSGAVTLKEGHQLIRSGPYALVRHPIYTGLMVAAAGTALARASIAGIFGLVLIGVVCALKIRAEERLMTEQFGDAYRDYQRQARTLIPFVW